MAERDWLSELSEAIGDDAPPLPPATPDESDEMLLSGPGRPLDGWADQLASAPAEEAPAEPAEAPTPVRPLPPPAPSSFSTAGSSSFTTWSGATVASVDPEVVVARLARVESLLSADLNRLGPAVLSESIAAIEARVDAALARLAGLDGPLDSLDERVSAYARTLAEPVRVHAMLPTELIEHLGQITTRLAALENAVVKAVATTPDDGTSPRTAVEVALLAERADHEQTMAVVTELSQVLAQVQARVDDLVARPVSAIDATSQQPIVDFEPMLQALNEHRIDTNSLAVILRHHQQSLHELVQRPVVEVGEAVEIEPVITAVVALHRELSAISSAVSELAEQSGPSTRSEPAVDLAPLEAALTEQRRELAGMATAITSLEDLRQLVPQLYTAVVEMAARPADAKGVQVVVPAESLAPVARVLGNRIEEGRTAGRADIELLASTLGDRLSTMESELGELARRIEALHPDTPPA